MDDVNCPDCGSNNVLGMTNIILIAGIITVIFSFILGRIIFPLGVISFIAGAGLVITYIVMETVEKLKNFHCENCGNMFSLKDTDQQTNNK